MDLTPSDITLIIEALREHLKFYDAKELVTPSIQMKCQQLFSIINTMTKERNSKYVISLLNTHDNECDSCHMEYSCPIREKLEGIQRGVEVS